MKSFKYIFVIVVIAGIVWLVVANKNKPKQEAPIAPEAAVVTTDYKNTTYVIENQPITLIDGYSQTTDPDMGTAIETKYFGNHVEGDFNGDGLPDAAILLTQNPGGSGTFYYVALALGTPGGNYQGVNSVYLGDRISPQTTEFRDGVIIVNYQERNADEPMTAQPSVGVSQYFKVVGGKLLEVKNPASR